MEITGCDRDDILNGAQSAFDRAFAEPFLKNLSTPLADQAMISRFAVSIDIGGATRPALDASIPSASFCGRSFTAGDAD